MVRVECRTNPAWTPGTKEWFERFAPEFPGLVNDSITNVRPVAYNSPYLRQYVVETLGLDWDAWCRERHVEPALIDGYEHGIAVLEGEGHRGPVSHEQALTAAQRAAKTTCAESHGGKRFGAGRPGGSVPMTIVSSADRRLKRGGTDVLASRIARDHPDILEAMKAGKFSSVRAAALAAGIVRPVDPVARAVRLVLRLTTKQRAEFWARLPPEVRP